MICEFVCYFLLLFLFSNYAEKAKLNDVKLILDAWKLGLSEQMLKIKPTK